MSLFDLAPSPVFAALRAAGHRGVHNFTVGTLTTYFRLETAQAQFDGRVLIIDGLPGSASRKVFVYSSDVEKEHLEALQRTSVIYSLDRLPLLKGSVFKEMAYDLLSVFSPGSYPDARKRHKRLKQPSTRLTGRGYSIRLLGPKDVEPVRLLHRRWCDWKLSQPKTFQMMFPKRRYMACIEMAISRPREYFAVGCFNEAGQVVAARALYIEHAEGGSAFDLACFGAAWEQYSNFTEDFYIRSLELLMHQGIGYVNCGSTLTKSLGAFKGHWPHRYVESFAYGKL